MGRATSLSCLNIFRPRYHPISESSDSQTQSLLYNHNQFMEADLDHNDVQALWEKFSVLEKEIGAFKSRLEMKFQIKEARAKVLDMPVSNLGLAFVNICILVFIATFIILKKEEPFLTFRVI